MEFSQESGRLSCNNEAGSSIACLAPWQQQKFLSKLAAPQDDTIKSIEDRAMAMYCLTTEHVVGPFSTFIWMVRTCPVLIVQLQNTTIAARP
jgi:hypothetical protein